MAEVGGHSDFGRIEGTTTCPIRFSDLGPSLYGIVIDRGGNETDTWGCRWNLKKRYLGRIQASSSSVADLVLDSASLFVCLFCEIFISILTRQFYTILLQQRPHWPSFFQTSLFQFSVCRTEKYRHYMKGMKKPDHGCYLDLGN